MAILFWILIAIAGLLALLDLVLANVTGTRRYWLLPVGVLVLILAVVLWKAGVA